MATFNLRRGYDIPIAGAPASEVSEAAKPQTVAICPVDFLGIKARPLAEEGQAVKIGTPLASSKDDESHVITSPASGTLKEIRRGHRRVITHLVIACDGKDTAESYARYELAQIAGLGREKVLAQVKASGLLFAFRERPFNSAARPVHTPRDIFISTFDSGPLGVDMNLVVQGREAAFQAGLEVCRALTTGQVHLGVDGKGKNLSKAFTDAKNVQIHRFSGPHPAGNVGTHIHLVAPVKKRNDVVWTTTVAGVIRLGTLFLEGRVDPSTLVAVSGSAATERKHVRTVLGAPVKTILGGKAPDGDVRYISGNVLTGAKVSVDDYLHYYDNLLTVIPEATHAEFNGWMLPGGGKDSWYRIFLGKLVPGKRFQKDTRLGGGHRAMVFTGQYEAVTPIDVLPGFLYKSILANDIEEMEGLGIYEVVEEDIALCEYICPSKTDFQKVLRAGIRLIEKEG